jgi:putative flippase GtrA
MAEKEDEAMSEHPQGIADTRAQLARQIPPFLIIGALGFCLDAAITVSLAQGFGVPPLLARPPAFVIVTLINFALNRAFTFRAMEAPWLAALGRYVLVCLAGLAVNYAIYAACLGLARWFGIVITPAILTLFVACGTAAATGLTFAGFRGYAFKS